MINEMEKKKEENWEEELGETAHPSSGQREKSMEKLAPRTAGEKS